MRTRTKRETTDATIGGTCPWLRTWLRLALGGCATDVGPSAAELKARWEAQNVFPQNYKNDLLAFMRTYLNDPEHVARRDGVAAAAQDRSGRASALSSACVTGCARTAVPMGRPRMAPRPMCRASSIASSTRRRNCEVYVQGRRHWSRSPKWKSSRAKKIERRWLADRTGAHSASKKSRRNGRAQPPGRKPDGTPVQTKRSKAASGYEVT